MLGAYDDTFVGIPIMDQYLHRCEAFAPKDPLHGGKQAAQAGVVNGVTVEADAPFPKISILDLAPVVAGSTPRAALLASVEHARQVDAWATRYWVAEHHGMPGIASSAPGVLIGALAAATERVRVGSGGVMLPNHAPLAVAEQFGMLEAMHPGRIDLGLGRAPGTDPATARALRRGVRETDFSEQLGELMAFFTGGFPAGHPYAALDAVPARGYQPGIWLLGSSGYSAQLAGMCGLPFAFAHHFSAENTLPALALYRDRFQPGTAAGALPAPYVMIGVNVVCAETDEAARELAEPGLLWMLRLRMGRLGLLPTQAEAKAYPWTAGERAVVEEIAASHVIGSPGTVERKLRELARLTGADELIVTSNVPDLTARAASSAALGEMVRRESLVAA